MKFIKLFVISIFILMSYNAIGQYNWRGYFAEDSVDYRVMKDNFYGSLDTLLYSDTVLYKNVRKYAYSGFDSIQDTSARKRDNKPRCHLLPASTPL